MRRSPDLREALSLRLRAQTLSRTGRGWVGAVPARPARNPAEADFSLPVRFAPAPIHRRSARPHGSHSRCTALSATPRPVVREGGLRVVVAANSFALLTLSLGTPPPDPPNPPPPPRHPPPPPRNPLRTPRPRRHAAAGAVPGRAGGDRDRRGDWRPGRGGLRRAGRDLRGDADGRGGCLPPARLGAGRVP